jgi:hypothetical protein
MEDNNIPILIYGDFNLAAPKVRDRNESLILQRREKV